MTEAYYVLVFLLGELFLIRQARSSFWWLALPITMVVGISQLSTSLLTLLLCVVVLALTYIFFNRMSIVQSVLLAVIFFCLVLFAELVSVILCLVLRFNLIGVQFGLSLACIALLEGLVVRFVLPHLIILEQKDWWLSAILLLMPFIGLLALPVNYVQIQPDEWRLLLLFFVFSYGLLAYMYVRTFYFSQIKKDLRLEKQKQNALIQQQERLQHHYQNQFHSLHSILHELARVDHALAEQRIEGAKERLEELSQQLAHELQVAYTESFYLSLVINEKREAIEQAGLLIRTDMPFLRFSFLTGEQIIHLYTLLVELSLVGEKQRMLYIQSRQVNEKMVMIVHLPVEGLETRLTEYLDEIGLKCSWVVDDFGIKLTLME